MWKNLMIIAIICGVLQWVLFGANLIFDGFFDFIIFYQAILWSIWAIICFDMFKRNNY